MEFAKFTAPLKNYRGICKWEIRDDWKFKGESMSISGKGIQLDPLTLAIASMKGENFILNICTAH